MKIKYAIYFILFLLGTAEYANSQNSIVELVKKVKTAIVQVKTYDTDGEPIKLGSGFFVTDDGEVITNRHVIVGSNIIRIFLSPTDSFEVKNILSEDKISDLVKMKIDGHKTRFNSLSISDYIPEEGEEIVVIGNPLGYESSISNGIVSAIRNLPGLDKYIQLTAPISQGSSGSPVFNMKGKVVGVATLQVVGGQNLNFAVPAQKIFDMKTVQYKSCKDWLIQNSDKKSENAREYFYQGRSCLIDGNYETATEYITKAIKIDPNQAEYYTNLLFCYAFLNDSSGVENIFKMALKHHPKNDTLYIVMGVYYQAKNNFDRAEILFKKAIQINSSSDQAYVLLADRGSDKEMCRYNHERSSVSDSLETKLNKMTDTIYCLKPIEYLKKAIQIAPLNGYAHTVLAQYYQAMKRYEDALDEFKIATNIKSSESNARVYLGLLYKEFKNFEKAQSEIQKAIDISPRNAFARYSLGTIYNELLDLENAIKYFKQAIDLSNSLFVPLSYRLELAMTYWNNGQRDKALEEYELIKKDSPLWAEKLFDSWYK